MLPTKKILGSISIENNFCNNQNLNKFFENLNLFSNQSATKLNLKKKILLNTSVNLVKTSDGMMPIFFFLC